MRDQRNVLEALSRSAFRSRFSLGVKERAYLDSKGMSIVMRHAAEFIAQRLAPAHPVNDGKQTPLRGHPVFIAQHATATCCRGCLEKWHDIPGGRPLSVAECNHICSIIEHWLQREQLGMVSRASKEKGRRS